MNGTFDPRMQQMLSMILQNSQGFGAQPQQQAPAAGGIGGALTSIAGGLDQNVQRQRMSQFADNPMAGMSGSSPLMGIGQYLKGMF